MYSSLMMGFAARNNLHPLFIILSSALFVTKAIKEFPLKSPFITKSEKGLTLFGSS